MDIWEKIVSLRKLGVDLVVVTIAATRGSVPGQSGAKAIVTADGLMMGNLGGGKVEAKAVEFAKGILKRGAQSQFLTWNLQRDVGMTCGGEMTFLFEGTIAKPPWHIAVFGAGHVSQALVPVLATLPCRVDVFDTRVDWLAKFPELENVRVHCVSSFQEGVELLSERSFVMAITQGHSSDRPVLRAVLGKFPEVPFLGVIGSASKRAVLMRELREDGVPEELLEKIICPIGIPVGGNEPAEISISIAAQLLEVRDRLAKERQSGL